MLSLFAILAYADSDDYRAHAYFLFGMMLLIFVLPSCIGAWLVFVKAGRPGWASIIPIYNEFLLLRITGLPLWWIVFCFIPYANFIPAVMVPFRLARTFGRDWFFGLGILLFPFIFLPVLGFGPAVYRDPLAPPAPDAAA